MNKEYMPAWLETLWNVNPSLAERAEKDVDELTDKVDHLSEIIKGYECVEKCFNCRGAGLIVNYPYSEDCRVCGGTGFL